MIVDSVFRQERDGPVFIEQDAVHIWKIQLDVEENFVDALQQCLAKDENARVERYYFERDKNHFIVSRGALRIILGNYMQREPETILFKYDYFGKPFVQNADAGIRFNLTHSHELCLIAVSPNLELGIDVEKITDIESMNIAKKFFSRTEYRELKTLPISEQKDAFYRCWTRKEAYIKAKGQGLSIPLASFDVSLDRHEPIRLLRSETNPKDVQRFSFYSFDVDKDYVAALAINGKNSDLYFYQFPFKSVQIGYQVLTPE